MRVAVGAPAGMPLTVTESETLFAPAADVLRAAFVASIGVYGTTWVTSPAVPAALVTPLGNELLVSVATQL